ncbi:MAG: transcription antitermination factor NusB [Lachnospiraceae bacterium]
MTRSEVREHIFKLLFRVEFNQVEDMPQQLLLYFEDPAQEDGKKPPVPIPEKEEQYIRNKYAKIADMLKELDELIDAAAKGWKSSRLGKVDLTILRLAVYEMKYDDDIPVGVAIDEAVELAKKFGQDESPAFINGILAKIAK